MQGRSGKTKRRWGYFLKMLWADIFIRGALMLARNRWQASVDGRRNAGMQE